MAIDTKGYGLVVLRVCIGVFFLFAGLGKIAWFTDPTILAGMFTKWGDGALPASAWYLQKVAVPYVPVFARLVPLGEIVCGLAMIGGFWTRIFAGVAFFMAMNFHVAGGTVFHYAFLTNAYGLPVIGATLGLALAGGKLPWSIRG
jgi:uncharacterized membrane protein YphA (DoxX/SURF4 family)